MSRRSRRPGASTSSFRWVEEPIWPVPVYRIRLILIFLPGRAYRHPGLVSLLRTRGAVSAFSLVAVLGVVAVSAVVAKLGVLAGASCVSEFIAVEALENSAASLKVLALVFLK